MGRLGVPSLTPHTLWRDVHRAAVIGALFLDTGRRDVDVYVFTRVRI